MTTEELKNQFKKAIEVNKYNFDLEYLNQLNLEIVNLEEEKDGWIKVAYKVHNFNFREIEENEIGCRSNGFGMGLYNSICVDSDLMKKDPKIAGLIDLAEEEAEEIAEKKRKKNRSWFYKIFPFLESEIAYMGMCHAIWHEQKKILKEKYGIDWQTPQNKFPNAKFD